MHQPGFLQTIGPTPAARRVKVFRSGPVFLRHFSYRKTTMDAESCHAAFVVGTLKGDMAGSGSPNLIRSCIIEHFLIETTSRWNLKLWPSLTFDHLRMIAFHTYIE